VGFAELAVVVMSVSVVSHRGCMCMRVVKASGVQRVGKKSNRVAFWCVCVVCVTCVTEGSKALSLGIL